MRRAAVDRGEPLTRPRAQPRSKQAHDPTALDCLKKGAELWSHTGRWAPPLVAPRCAPQLRWTRRASAPLARPRVRQQRGEQRGERKDRGEINRPSAGGWPNLRHAHRLQRRLAGGSAECAKVEIRRGAAWGQPVEGCSGGRAAAQQVLRSMGLRLTQFRPLPPWRRGAVCPSVTLRRLPSAASSMRVSLTTDNPPPPDCLYLLSDDRPSVSTSYTLQCRR